MKNSQTRVSELERQLEQARRQSAAHDPIDPSNLTKLLGEETTRVLDAAQSAAAEIRAKAEENVARLLHEARDVERLVAVAVFALQPAQEELGVVVGLRRGALV